MSNTSTHPYGTGLPWLKRWFSGKPHMTIGGELDGHPYMLRWYILPRNTIANVYLHKFLRSDDDRALHDHPWTFWSLILKGSYDELTPDGINHRRPGSLARRSATQRHRVRLMPTRPQQARYDHIEYLQKLGVEHELPPRYFGLDRPEEKSVWTLVVTGKKVREWGFWCPGKSAHVKNEHGDLVVVDIDERFVHWQKFTEGANNGCGE